MSNKSSKLSLKKSQIKHRMRPAIAIGIILLAAASLFATLCVKNYLAEQQTLRELGQVSKDLRVVYDRLLELNKGNTTSSYLKDQCSSSYIGPYAKVISCGQGAEIVVREDTGVDRAKITISEATNGSRLALDGAIDSDSHAVSARFVADRSQIFCYISYGYRTKSNSWSYQLSCSKDTDGFLPGYEIK